MLDYQGNPIQNQEDKVQIYWDDVTSTLFWTYQDNYNANGNNNPVLCATTFNDGAGTWQSCILLAKESPMKSRLIWFGVCILAGVVGMGLWRGVGHLLLDHAKLHDLETANTSIVNYLNSHPIK